MDACRNNPFATDAGAGTRGIGGAKGLARVAAPESTLILYAAKPGQVASDNPAGRNSLFTKHLRDAIARLGVNIEEAFANVTRGVYRDSNQQGLGEADQHRRRLPALFSGVPERSFRRHGETQSHDLGSRRGADQHDIQGR